MPVGIVTAEDWARARESASVASTLNPDGSVWWSAGPETALELVNTRFGGLSEQLVGLVVDGYGPTGPDGNSAGKVAPIPRHHVREVRYFRRDPTGRYASLERRPGLAEALDLAPHPEGGWFRQTWAAPVMVTPEGYPGERATATAILFLLPPGAQSCWHQVRSDEVWFWQRGGALELTLGGDGDVPKSPVVVTLAPAVEAGQCLQAVVPGGTWQAARPAAPEDVLLSTVVSPGFDFADFRAGGQPYQRHPVRPDPFWARAEAWTDE